MKMLFLIGLPATVLAVGALGAARSIQHAAPAASPRAGQPAARNMVDRKMVDWTRAANPALGANVLKNAGFAHRDEDWTLQASPEPAAATLQIAEAGSELPEAAGRVAHINTTTPGSKPWHVRLWQKGLDLKDGHTYVLTFWARADRERSIRMRATLDTEFQRAVGLDKKINLSTEWRKCSTRFTAEGTVPGHSRIAFQLGEAPGVVEIADLALQRDPAASASRAPHPIIGTWRSRAKSTSQRFRFTFNADGTGSIREAGRNLAPAAAPHSPAANPFRWYLKDENRVRLASRDYEWSIEREGRDQTLTLKSTRGTSILFRERAGL